MANVLDIRRRIRSVKSTQQITRAMKMVAAAKMRRAQERVFAIRPYANQMLALLGSVAARTEQRSHPLLAERPVEKILVILITADRGLCGAFNANLIRAMEKYLVDNADKQVSMIAVGRKGRDYFHKRDAKIVSEYVNIFSRLQLSHAQEISKQIRELYTSGEVDAVDFVYNESKSVLTQKLTLERYLPVKPIKPHEEATLVDYIYEQPPAEIFGVLLDRYVEIEVYRALLESQSGELAAKMTAMDAATNNAAEMIDSLTLHMNRVRQAAITKEIIEIVSGAGAL
jgi:F-type H+-transporting ATPase subunit gamma